MESRPVLIPLGGFLGAGKTTLILSASRLLQAQGLKPAAILTIKAQTLSIPVMCGRTGSKRAR